MWWVKEPRPPADGAGRWCSSACAISSRSQKLTKSLRSTAGRPPSTLVLIDRLDIGADGDLVLVGIEGSHFLWKMVRRLVGVLAEMDAAASIRRRRAISRRELQRAGAAHCPAVGTVPRARLLPQ
jgi:tRNA pseudouridine38-40 synthase